MPFEPPKNQTKNDYHQMKCSHEKNEKKNKSMATKEKRSQK